MAPDLSTLSDDDLRQHRDNLRDEVALIVRHVAALVEEHAQALRDRETAEMGIMAAEAALEAFDECPEDDGDAPSVVVT